MRNSALTLLLMATILVGSSTVFADCSYGAPGDSKEINLQVKSCSGISFDTDDSLQEKAGKMLDKQIARRFFTGALIEDEQGTQWIYPTDSNVPCGDFNSGKIIRMNSHRTCCDTGRWGKCALGGRFLSTIGATPLDAYQ